MQNFEGQTKSIDVLLKVAYRNQMAVLSATRFIYKLDFYFYLNYLQGSCRTRQQDHGGQRTTP